MTIKQQGGVFGRHPEFSSVEIDGVGTLHKDGSKLNITAAGGVEIDGSQLFNLAVNGGVQINDERLRVLLTGNTSYAEIGVDYTSAYLRSTFSSGGTSDFRFLHNASEIMRITANGITFGGDTAAANALDDYEEGTWTVELYDADSAGNASPTTVTGQYTKVGRVVHASFGPLNNIDTTGMTSGNTLRITLPFTPTENSTGSVVVDNFAFGTGRTAISPVTLSGQSRARLFDIGDGVAFHSMPVSSITSGASDILRFSITYIS
jgi:hypothetical protein